MSLKHFHLVFIFLATLCAFGFAAWAFFAAWADSVMRVPGGFSVALGVFLIAYGVWFWKKSRHLVA
jgi:hypothetical protein